MPKIDDTPDGLRPYLAHGLALQWTRTGPGAQALGSCPFCSKPKFYVNVENTRWDCKSCGKEGNASDFLRDWWELCYDKTQDYDDLALSRQLLHGNTPQEWGACVSFLNGQWLVPGYGSDGQIKQLYRYLDRPGGAKALLPTPGLGHALHGANLYDPNIEDVYLCEGAWDGMALYEVILHSKYTANVLAVPSCHAWSDHWAPLFAGKNVTILFDNDHPPVKNPVAGPAGFVGCKNIAQQIMAKGQPKSVRYLYWGEQGYDRLLPSGYDVRDLLTTGNPKPAERLKRLEQLLAKVRSVPTEWQEEAKYLSILKCASCQEWDLLEASWQKAMRWTDGLRRALAVMLACITSTQRVGDQLWVKIISPPATGKSTLCEAISIARKYVYPKSSIRGFHSGYKSDKDGKEDHGLIPKIKGKTLVTKDGDTLLQAPNLNQILAEARDIYDGAARVHYRHGLSRDEEGIRTTWILCGTSSLRALDTSELGERFLDCVIMDTIDDDEEDEILRRVALQAERNLSYQSNGKAEGQYQPELVRAMQLTGGYVNYLAQNADKLLSACELSDTARTTCERLAKFVAHMRARPSLKQQESHEREMAGRLVSQLVRLAKCLTCVLGRTEADEDVMDMVRRVAMDTARGKTLEMCQHLYKAGANGRDGKGLSWLVNLPVERVNTLTNFLRGIGVVEVVTLPGMATTAKPRWRLTPRMVRLYQEVVIAKG